MGKTQHGGKRVKRRSTYKKAGSTKPLTLLKSLAGASKKNIKVGRKLVRNDFLKKSFNALYPSLCLLVPFIHGVYRAQPLSLYRGRVDLTSHIPEIKNHGRTA